MAIKSSKTKKKLCFQFLIIKWSDERASVFKTDLWEVQNFLTSTSLIVEVLPLFYLPIVSQKFITA